MNRLYRETGNEYFIDETALLEGIAAGDEKFQNPEVNGSPGLKLTCKDARALADAISKHRHLQQAEFCFIEQEPGAFQIILRELKLCEELNWLCVSTDARNEKYSPLTADDIVEMANVIRSAKMLYWVWLQNLDMPSKDLQPIFQACRDSNSVQKFSINDSKLGLENISDISDMLLHNTSILEVNFYNNNLDHQCINQLAKAISSNKSSVLESLVLDMNEIGIIGMSHLALYFSSIKFPNSKLRELSLGGCELRGAGDVIGQLLARNKTITKLIIDCNQLVLEDLKLIAGGIRNNDTIQQIDISSQPFYVTQQLAPDPDVSKSPKPVQVFMSVLEKKLTENRALAESINSERKSTSKPQ